MVIFGNFAGHRSALLRRGRHPPAPPALGLPTAVLRPHPDRRAGGRAQAVARCGEALCSVVCGGGQRMGY